MYIFKNHSKTKLKNDLIIDGNRDNFESLFIEIINEKAPPNNNFYEFEIGLKTILSRLDNVNKPCYLMGDFNIDLLKYKQCNFSNLFFNQLHSSGFVPLIRKPTRITKRTATLIDNIFTNIINQTEHFNGILINDISDHLPVFTITKLDKYSQTIKPGLDAYTTRIITNSSLESFAQKLQQCDWQSTLSESDPIVSYEAFVKEFFGQYDKCFPIKKIKSKNAKRSENVWISIGLRKSSKTKEKLYKKFLTNKTVESETKYKVCRNKLNHLIRIAKKKITTIIDLVKHMIT